MAIRAEHAASSQADVPQLATARARKFLKQLSEESFVAFILVGDDLVVYTKGVDADGLRTIHELMSELST